MAIGSRRYAKVRAWAMLSIIDLSVAFPAREQPIEGAAAQLALTPTELKMFKRFYGFESFHIDDNQPLVELLDTAMSGLTARHPRLRTDLHILAHCHTISDIGTAGTDPLYWLRDRHLAGSTEVMSLTMNHCAIGVSMLMFLDAFLPPDGLGVLLIGEKAFHRTIRLIENTSIMGEAAAAILVGRGDGILTYLGGHTTHEGGFSIISGRPGGGSQVGFGAAYYEFMVTHIREVLAKYHGGFDDVRYVFPHNVNEASWRRIASALGTSPNKIYLQNLPRYGHCFGADPFVSVLNALEDGTLAIGDTVLLISAGLGGTVSTALMSVSSLSVASQARDAVEGECTPVTGLVTRAVASRARAISAGATPIGTFQSRNIETGVP
jgi:3-oxoacyl-[acyl-carrier-protein] synthase-3